jgi:hypothetical protein
MQPFLQNQQAQAQYYNQLSNPSSQMPTGFSTPGAVNPLYNDWSQTGGGYGYGGVY